MIYGGINMNLEKLDSAIYDLEVSVRQVKVAGKERELSDILIETGFTDDNFDVVSDLIRGRKDIIERITQDAMDDYTKVFTELVEVAKVAQGYKDMSEINLSISEEYFEIENESERLNEVETEEIKTNNQ